MQTFSSVELHLSHTIRPKQLGESLGLGRVIEVVTWSRQFIQYFIFSPSSAELLQPKPKKTGNRDISSSRHNMGVGASVYIERSHLFRIACNIVDCRYSLLNLEIAFEFLAAMRTKYRHADCSGSVVFSNVIIDSAGVPSILVIK